MDQPPLDSTQPTSPVPLTPVLPVAPQVTLLSKVAGIILLLSGLWGLLFCAIGVLAFLFVRTRDELIQLVIAEIVIFVVACVVSLGGIDILRSKDRGRTIGIGSSLLLGAGALITEIVSPDGLVFWLPVGLYASSLYVLLARWRTPAPAAASQPPGPVTLLSRVAGVVLLLLGLGLMAYGGGFSLRDDSDLAASAQGISRVIGFCIILTGIPELLVGIAILRGKEWGRLVGIAISVLFGPLTLLVAIGFMQVRINGIGDPGSLIYRPAFVVYAYSLLVLVARWRGPARATEAPARSAGSG